MRAAGVSIPQFAAKSKTVDPEGKGLSQALVGFHVSTGRSAREEVTERTVRLMVATFTAFGVHVDAEELVHGTTA